MIRFKQLAVFLALGLFGCSATEDNGQPPGSASAPTTTAPEVTTPAPGTDPTDTTPPVPTSVTPGPVVENTPPTPPSSTPGSAGSAAVDVPINTGLTVTFSEVMDAATFTSDTFVVTTASGTQVNGTVKYLGSTATFTPSVNLDANTQYTATITTGAKDLAGNSMAAPYVWTFTTGSTAAKGPPAVILGTAGNFVILAKTAISVTGPTAITGNLAVSPAAQSYITGFSEALDSTNVFATSSLVTGKIYASDMAVPTPSNLTTAVSDMEIAYTDAAGRVTPDFTELGAGDVSGQTLIPGLYKWGTGLLMTSDVTISGGPNDTWIFQIAQDLLVSNGVHITLAGGAQPQNIFWQVAGQVTLGTTAVMKGVILSQTQVVLETGATLDGRALAQTAVTLDANAVTQPAK